VNSATGYQGIGVLMIGGGLLTMYAAFKGNPIKSVLTGAINPSSTLNQSAAATLANPNARPIALTSNPAQVAQGQAALPPGAATAITSDTGNISGG
jgi:hypothetical protein